MEQQLSKACLLLDDESIQKNYLHEVENMLAKTDIEVSLIAIDKPLLQARRSKEDDGGYWNYHSVARSIIKEAQNESPKLIGNAEQFLAEVIHDETAEEKRRELKQRIPLDSHEYLRRVERIYFTPTKIGNRIYEFPDEVVDKIVSASDVVISLNHSRILRGRILTAPDYGVLSFHGSDFRKYRGRPSGYWQYLNKEDTIGLTLQQLTNELDGGKIVVCDHADISDANTWWDVKLATAKLYGPQLAKGIELLQDPCFTPTELDSEELGELTYESDRYSWKNELRLVFRHLIGRYLNY